MHVGDLEQWLKRRPFEPFVMHPSSGERIRVDHPDAAVPGTNSVLVLYKRRGRLAGFAHFALASVVKIAGRRQDGRGRARQRL